MNEELIVDDRIRLDQKVEFFSISEYFVFFTCQYYWKFK